MEELRLQVEAQRLEIEALRLQLQKAVLVFENPYTIWTVDNVLELNLTPSQRMQAGLLAYKVFKSLYPDKEPHEYSGINRYSVDDLWIVKISVKRVFDGISAPTEDLLPNEIWTKCCAEVHHLFFIQKHK